MSSRGGVDLVVAAEVAGIVVSDLAVGAQDRFELAGLNQIIEQFGVVHDLDVLLRLHLEQELIASAACRITGAGLTLAEYHELHSGGVDEFGHCLCRAPRWSDVESEHRLDLFWQEAAGCIT